MIDDFIGVFDNVISNELCDELIKVYEDSNKLNFAISRQSMGKEKVKPVSYTHLTLPTTPYV